MKAEKLLFRQLFDHESSTYSYLLADKETREGILIDPVLEQVSRDTKLIKELRIKLLFTLETHIHADHITGASKIRLELQSKIGVPYPCGAEGSDFEFKDQDEISFGSFKIKAFHTPGHTDVSYCFHLLNMLFTGDTLLIRGTGRTDFQSGSSTELYKSITKTLFQFPKEYLVYPGHDYKGMSASSIEEEMKFNPRVGESKSMDEFVNIMENLNLAYPKKIDIAVPGNMICGA